MKAIARVETSLSERYLVTCANCSTQRQFFGTLAEARGLATRHGWFFLSKAPVECILCPPCVPQYHELARNLPKEYFKEG